MFNNSMFLESYKRTVCYIYLPLSAGGGVASKLEWIASSSLPVPVNAALLLPFSLSLRLCGPAFGASNLE